MSSNSKIRWRGRRLGDLLLIVVLSLVSLPHVARADPVCLAAAGAVAIADDLEAVLGATTAAASARALQTLGSTLRGIEIRGTRLNLLGTDALALHDLARRAYLTRVIKEEPQRAILAAMDAAELIGRLRDIARTLDCKGEVLHDHAGQDQAEAPLNAGAASATIGVGRAPTATVLASSALLICLGIAGAWRLLALRMGEQTRHDCILPARLRLGLTTYDVTTCDISRLGLKLRIPDDAYLDRGWRVEIDLMDRVHEARISWRTQFFVGLALQSRLSRSELRALIGRGRAERLAGRTHETATP